MTTLRIIEIYASVQGESSLVGYPTTFVRLAMCNLRCVWCDTSYSFGRGQEKRLEDIITEVTNLALPYVCITGGEPLLQTEVHLLMKALADLQYNVSLETGGSLPTTDVDPRVKIILDIKCPGSGMEKKNYWENLHHLRPHDEVKFVLLDREDYLWAHHICKEYKLFEKGAMVLLSPVHGRLNPQDLVKWMMEDRFLARLNLQVHKYIWTPETKGV